MMNEKEWAEFFELTQGRKPQPEDYQKAALAGEYQPDQTVVELANQTPAEGLNKQQEPSIPVSATGPTEQNPQPMTAATGAMSISSQPQVTAPANGPASPAPAMAPIAAPAKPSVFKKMGQAFKRKDGHKGWPLWLNIGIMVVIALVLLILGIFAHSSQEKASQKDISGDWQLTETAYYKSDDWTTFSRDGKIVDGDSQSDYENVQFDTYLTSKNGGLVSYNATTVSTYNGDYIFAFASPAHPSLTFNINKKGQAVEVRIDDDDYFNYYPAKTKDHVPFDDLKAKFFVKDQELTIVYYDDDQPYFKETYKSISGARAKKAKRNAKDYYISYKDFYNKVNGDDSDDYSNIDDSEHSDFQAG